MKRSFVSSLIDVTWSMLLPVDLKLTSSIYSDIGFYCIRDFLETEDRKMPTRFLLILYRGIPSAISLYRVLEFPAYIVVDFTALTFHILCVLRTVARGD